MAIFCVIVSMYGGGFATVPAYLADVFGTRFVGAIHGRLLTAWSTAGVIGPVVVNYVREAQVSAGLTGSALYSGTMYILAGMLVLGFIANLLVRPVPPRLHMGEVSSSRPDGGTVAAGGSGIGTGGFSAPVAAAWFLVCLPILWGVWITLSKTFVLFQ